MRSLAGVSSHVSVQFAGMLKCSSADGAGVRTFLGVNPSVNIQILLNTEGLVAIFTPAQ